MNNIEERLVLMEVWIKIISDELNKQLPGYAKHTLNDALTAYNKDVAQLKGDNK